MLKQRVCSRCLGVTKNKKNKKIIEILKSYRASKMNENRLSVSQILRQLQVLTEKVYKIKVVALKI